MAGAALVAGLIVLAPLARGAGWAALSWVLYRAFGVACHQMPERAFHVAGHPLAVCARCWGLYAGALAGLLAYPLARSLARTDAPWRGWLLLAAVPTSIDFLLGVTGLWENTHASRFWTALPLGAAAAFYISPAVIELSLSATLRSPRGGRAAAGRGPARAARAG
ncbi:MAG: DUF2085 domain-containing protein [Acetobacteraceae bacterium]|nr:DUF2085 domain-containing protein [Acetobacteraceae bacterium]